MCNHSADCPRRQELEHRPAADFLAEMADRLAHEGGLISEAALQARLVRRGHSAQEALDWAGRLGLRGFRWKSQRWLPVFQMEPEGLTHRADVAAVADELSGAMDDEEILAWFACPNPSLDGRTPLACLQGSFETVRQAARMDNFLASA